MRTEDLDALPFGTVIGDSSAMWVAIKVSNHHWAVSGSQNLVHTVKLGDYVVGPMRIVEQP